MIDLDAQSPAKKKTTLVKSLSGDDSPSLPKRGTSTVDKSKLVTNEMLKMKATNNFNTTESSNSGNFSKKGTTKFKIKQTLRSKGTDKDMRKNSSTFIKKQSKVHDSQL